MRERSIFDLVLLRMWWFCEQSRKKVIFSWTLVWSSFGHRLVIVWPPIPIRHFHRGGVLFLGMVDWGGMNGGKESWCSWCNTLVRWSSAKGKHQGWRVRSFQQLKSVRSDARAHPKLESGLRWSLHLFHFRINNIIPSVGSFKVNMTLKENKFIKLLFVQLGTIVCDFNHSCYHPLGPSYNFVSPTNEEQRGHRPCDLSRDDTHTFLENS